MGGGGIPACIVGGIPAWLAAGLQGGGIPACIAGGIPACLAAGLQGGGIPACLAGFQAHTQGGSLGGSDWGVSRPTPIGEVEGDLARVVSRPTPKGKVVEDQARGSLQAQTWGGAWSWGCLLLGGAWSQGGACSGGMGKPPRMATAASCTHPTGMHSCCRMFVDFKNWMQGYIEVQTSL